MEVVTGILLIFAFYNTLVTDKMEAVTSVLRFVIHSLRLFAVCHTPVTDKVKVVTHVLQIVVHSLRMKGNL